MEVLGSMRMCDGICVQVCVCEGMCVHSCVCVCGSSLDRFLRWQRPESAQPLSAQKQIELAGGSWLLTLELVLNSGVNLIDVSTFLLILFRHVCFVMRVLFSAALPVVLLAV